MHAFTSRLSDVQRAQAYMKTVDHEAGGHSPRNEVRHHIFMGPRLDCAAPADRLLQLFKARSEHSLEIMQRTTKDVGCCASGCRGCEGCIQRDDVAVDSGGGAARHGDRFGYDLQSQGPSLPLGDVSAVDREGSDPDCVGSPPDSVCFDPRDSASGGSASSAYTSETEG